MKDDATQQGVYAQSCVPGVVYWSTERRCFRGRRPAGLQECSGDVVGEVAEPKGGGAQVPRPTVRAAVGPLRVRDRPRLAGCLRMMSSARLASPCVTRGPHPWGRHTNVARVGSRFPAKDPAAAPPAPVIRFQGPLDCAGTARSDLVKSGGGRRSERLPLTSMPGTRLDEVKRRVRSGRANVASSTSRSRSTIGKPGARYTLTLILRAATHSASG